MSDATKATAAVHSAVTLEIDLDDARDFSDAKRGFVCALEPPTIKTSTGKTLVDLSERTRLVAGGRHPPPKTVNPSLWREVNISAPYGLYKVVDKVYQVKML
jgi:alkyl sulfatase BDS1-like metallo-beta-lactamase superfamily hydrolase